MAKWIMPSIVQEVPGSDLVARLLVARGFRTDEDRQEFLAPVFQALFSPLLFRQMPEAVNRILAARDASETVAIVGDYDADGITATALLCRLCQVIGLPEPLPILPHRLHDGYGLTPSLVERAKRGGAGLIITVDNGISGIEAARTAAGFGIDLIVTDHHRPLGELPECLAIIDPWLDGERYPFRDLSGVGVAYKLAAAVLARAVPSAVAEHFLKWAFDLVAIGTIADVMPLVGENRIFVRHGLAVLSRSKSAGLRALLAQCRVQPPLDAQMVAFRLAPRLNAAGRLADPALALDLLLESDEARARVLAQDLERLNGERQGMVTAAMAEATGAARQSLAAGERLVIVKSRNWPQGIVGLVAGKLCEQFRMPVVALSNNHDEAVHVASCRALPGFDVAAFIEHFRDSFLKSGGHAAAGGFSIAAEGLALFEEAALSWARERSGTEAPEEELAIDAVLEGRDASVATVSSLVPLAPFGAGNPEPVFAFERVAVESCRSVGDRGQHRQFRFLARDGQPLEAVAFGVAEGALQYPAGTVLDVAGNLRLNEYNGRTSVKLNVLDIIVR